MKKELFADILFPFALQGSFTYGIPDQFTKVLAVGKRVLAPFGKKKFYSGIVLKIHETNPDKFEVKNIISVLDDYSVVTDFQLQLWNWISTYYLCSLGEVCKAALPSALRMESETNIQLNTNLDEISDLTEKEIIIYNALQSKESISVSQVNKLLDLKNAMPVIKTLIEKNIISTEESIKDAFTPKSEVYLKLSEVYHNEEMLLNTLEKLKKAAVQSKVLEAYLQLSDFPYKGIHKKIITGQIENSQAAIKALVDKGILNEYKIEVGRLPKKVSSEYIPVAFNIFQKQAYASICEAFKKQNIALLYGITSSGKTEIYIKLIKDYIDAGKQVLYLVPEIALTTQMIKRLVHAFGDKVGVYHSKYSDSERVEIWNSILGVNKNQKYQIILGARSATLLPFSNLGLIIVDEEHESSYKQFDPAPRYHARDVAIILAKIHGAKTLLGSASPSIEAWHNAKAGKFAFVELIKRYQEIELPEIVLIDTRPIYFKKRMMSHFSPFLIGNIKEALEKKEQIILFQNRRGFSPYLECLDCGWIPKCRHCNVSLTYHKFNNKLVCHYCGYTTKTVTKCTSCNSIEVHTKGFGTEKVEEELKLIIPDAKIARLDFDTAKTRKDYERIIHDFEEQKTDILVGTQMITKGLNFNHVSIVGVLNADNMLNFPDYKSFERSFQLLVQVSGRAGRKGKQGKVIVQTSNPNHPVIKDFLYNEFYKFYETQIAERLEYNYPPFSRLIKLIIRHRKEDILDAGTYELIRQLKATFKDQILGPETPVVNRVQNYFLKNILIKLLKDKNLSLSKEKVLSAIREITAQEKYKYLSVTIDVDPI